MKILFQYKYSGDDYFDYKFEFFRNTSMLKFQFYNSNNEDEHTYLGKFKG